MSGLAHNFNHIAAFHQRMPNFMHSMQFGVTLGEMDAHYLELLREIRELQRKFGRDNATLNPAICVGGIISQPASHPVFA